MTAIDILFTSVGFIAAIVGIICYHLMDLDKLFVEWKERMLKHDKCFTDIEWHRVDDLSKLAALEQRVRVLEEQMSGLLMVTDESNFPDPEDEEIVI